MSDRWEFGAYDRWEFGVSICAIVRNEAPYLLEWIAYHRAVGVDHFFIYDNESDDGTSALLTALEAHRIVTRIPWPDRHSSAVDPLGAAQATAYRDFIRYKHRTQWVAVIDVDEFIVPLIDRTVGAMLGRFSDAEAVGINWRIFGDSGQEVAGPDLVMKRFRCRAEDDFPVNRHVKAITRTDALLELRNHYSCTRLGNYIDADGDAIAPMSAVHTRVANRFAQLNHYFGKSREEWLVKKARGRVAATADDPLKFRQDRDFDDHNRNDVEDDRILSFLAATEAELERLRGAIPALAVAPVPVGRTAILGGIEQIQLIAPGGEIQVGGWVMAQAGIDRVFVKIGSAPPAPAQFGLERTDLTAAYPAFADAGTSGFRCTIAVHDSGVVSLEVQAHLRNGAVAMIWQSVRIGPETPFGPHRLTM